MQQEPRTAELNALWQSLVQNPSILHIFKTARGDSKEMQVAFPALPVLHAFTNVVDVDELSKGLGFVQRVRLSLFVELFDGRPLDKRLQCSCWDLHPLTREQREYAAADAFVTRMVFLRMCEALKAKTWGVKERNNWVLVERKLTKMHYSIPMDMETPITITPSIQHVLDLYDSLSNKSPVCSSNDCNNNCGCYTRKECDVKKLVEEYLTKK